MAIWPRTLRAYHATPYTSRFADERLPSEGRQTVGVTKAAEEHRRVRVWFGENVIASHVAAPAIAARYEQAMRRRFAGLRVTNDAAPVR